MRRPNPFLIVTFLVGLGLGYAAAWGIMLGLNVEFRRFGFLNLTAIAFLVAVVLILVLDSPLNLRAFDWPEVKEEDRGPGNTTLKVSLFVIVVVAAIAGFARLIPQVESPAPVVLEISGDLSGAELAELGESVFESSEAGCLACHAIGHEGLRGPDLAGIGGRAVARIPGRTAEEYLHEALVDPCAFVVDGYDCIMPTTLAQTLGTAKVTALVAFLESMGGEITVSLSAEAAAGDTTAVGIEGTTAEEIMTNAGCTACHQLDAIEAAGRLGPDLSQIGTKLSPDQIRGSILDPDAAISEVCPDGPCTPGIMPKTFGATLSAAQLETLVSYLSSQK
jgi:cytochrome c2